MFPRRQKHPIGIQCFCVCSGVNFTEKNNDGKTALEVAQMNEQHDITKLLQDKENAAYL
jgi:ankyrin repeat protein